MLFFSPPRPTRRSPEKKRGEKKGEKTRSRVDEKRRGISGRGGGGGKEWKRGKKEKTARTRKGGLEGGGGVKRTRRAKTEYLIYEYVWGASSQLEKLTGYERSSMPKPFERTLP